MTEWRKHDPHFLLNAKIVRATMKAGPVVPILALTLLDLNAIGDRRGRLGREESQTDFLELRLLSTGLRDVTADQVEAAIEALSAAGFLTVTESGRIELPGWSDDEFGIRGRGPKPGDLRACDHCGEAFRPQRDNHRFCSAACRKADFDKGRQNASDASDGRTDGRTDAGVDRRNGEKEGRIDGETEYPPTPRGPSVGSEPSTPKGDSSAETSTGEPDPESPSEDAAIDEMVPICREAGIKAARFPLRRTLRGFYRDEGTAEVLRDLSALARTGSDPGGLLWKWLSDPYEWKSVIADRDAQAKHRKALGRSRKAAADEEFRDVNGQGEKPGAASLHGGAA